MKILSQAEQWPERVAGLREEEPDPDIGHAPLEHHGPSKAELDRLYGPGDEESPLFGAMLENISRHPSGPHPFGTPVYTPGGGIPHEDYDPNSSENLPPDEPGGEDVHHFGGLALDPEVEEHLVWRDPAYIDPAGEGHTYPHSLVGGDPEGTVSVLPRDKAGPHDAFVMPAEESGLGYPAVVRRNPKGDGYDVIKPMEDWRWGSPKE